VELLIIRRNWRNLFIAILRLIFASGLIGGGVTNKPEVIRSEHERVG